MDRRNHILIVGQNSFLGKELFEHLSRGHHSVMIIPHTELSQLAVSWSDIIVNFAINPLLYYVKYAKELDFDLALANLAARFDKKYVMISSRKVYPAYIGTPFVETLDLIPVTEYGRNKAITEAFISRLLGENALILRLTNIIGLEVIEGRKTTMGFLFNSMLQRETLWINTSHSTIKDYLPIQNFCEIMSLFLNNWRSGVFNIGSGVNFTIGNLVDLVLEQCNPGVVAEYANSVRDPFAVNIEKYTSLFGYTISEHALITAIRAYSDSFSQILRAHAN